jgi:hypothetical protein
VEDCDGPLDLTDLVCEASMWARGKLKKLVAADDTYFGLADGIGFDQILVGDIVVVDRVRLPEQMLVTGFDEANRLIQVQRGYNGSPVADHPKGTGVRIFRVLNATAATEMTTQDVTRVDGTVDEGVITHSYLVYEWAANDTCVPGCFWFEFKLLKMSAGMAFAGPLGACSTTPSISFISTGPDDIGCGLGDGVEWVRRFPLSGEGLLVKVVDSPTSEGLAA